MNPVFKIIEAPRLVLTLLVAIIGSNLQAQEAPRVITPGATSQSAPSDAIVLFDGTCLENWKGGNGTEAKWKLVDGTMEVNGTGSILTRQEFGSAQLHVEWRTPSEVKGNGQGRGNSGVYLQGRYEVQVLDSYENETYYNGQAGSIYGSHPPLVNACRKPGEWQTYDIIFHAPKLAEDGESVIPGTFTVLHNGVLIQSNATIGGSTTASQFKGVAPKGPLILQDHGNPVQYRNIWIRPLD